MAEIDREKVIKGLECCTRGDACVSDCPYFKEMPITDTRCITAVQADALALLKQQFNIDIPLKERNDNFDLYDTPIFGFHD